MGELVQKVKKGIKEFAYKKGYDIKTVDHYEVKNDLKMYHRLFPAESIRGRRFYNIGAGNFRHQAWTNMDYMSDWYKDSLADCAGMINFDLQSLKDFPIESDSAEVVYSSHTIEHITDKAVEKMLKESYRILKKGGFMRIYAPNIDLFYKAFEKEDRDFFYWIDANSKPEVLGKMKLKIPLNQATITQVLINEFATTASELCTEGDNKVSDKEFAEQVAKNGKEKALDYCTTKCSMEAQKRNAGFHLNWFNEGKLRKMLEKAGFENIYLSAFGQSFCPVLRNTFFFDNTAPKLSLYMEAKK